MISPKISPILYSMVFGPGGLLLEAVQVGEEFPVDEVAEVVAGLGPVVVDLAVLALGRGPFFPAVGLVEDVGVLLAVQRGFVGPVLLQPVQVFQEEEPRGLLGVVQFGGAAGLFPEDVVDVFEGLFKHRAGVGTNINGIKWYPSLAHWGAGREASPRAMLLQSHLLHGRPR